MTARIRALCAALLLGGGAIGAAQAEPLLPGPLQEVRFDQKLGTRLPLDAVFRDERGREVALGQLFHRRPVVLALFYHDCPMLCRMVLDGLVSCLSVIRFDAGREFDVVAVSFDPRDTPALAAADRASCLRRYGHPGSEPGWHFLTGDSTSIARVSSAVGFRYVPDEPRRQFAHAAGIVVVTPEGALARYFFGIEYPPRDVRLALVEAASGRIGTAVDQLLLYCFHYDPATGRYSAAILNLVRAGGLATVLGLTGLVFGLRRRESTAPRRRR